LKALNERLPTTACEETKARLKKDIPAKELPESINSNSEYNLLKNKDDSMVEDGKFSANGSRNSSLKIKRSSIKRKKSCKQLLEQEPQTVLNNGKSLANGE
jgi:hypothetical protein